MEREGGVLAPPTERGPQGTSTHRPKVVGSRPRMTSIPGGPYQSH